MRALSALALIALASPAAAVCAGNQVPVFACDIGAKQVELCLTTDEARVTYRFGPSAAPELELTRDFDRLTMTPWNGIGRTIWDRVSIPNGAFAYDLYWAYDKVDEVTTGGIEVRRGQTVLAALDCEAGGFYDLVTLSTAMQEAGFCRRDPADDLSQGACE